MAERQPALNERIEASFGNMGDKVIGELTGGDRALVNALEGFEDLLVIGDLQLQENHIQKGDVVICVTEGGETSSVIGTIQAAWRQYHIEQATTEEEKKALKEEARKNLYFIFNNPVDVLLPFDRSRLVLDCKDITKIPLWTGPQAIGGSTRMQASTSEQYAISIMIEDALTKALVKLGLTGEEMEALGFDTKLTIADRLVQF